jgi:hypothetical protein
MPNLFVIAGPNGAGKSTTAPELLTGRRRVAQFVNADVIAKEQGTLASHLLLPRIRSMQALGYRFHLLRVKDNELWKRLSAQHMKPRVEEKKVFPHPEQPWTAEDIEDAVNRAVTAALKRHKELGQSVVMWRDGKIVTLKPDEIEI